MEYLEAEDDIATWVNDRCVCDHDAWGSSTALYLSWCGWAKTAGVPIGSQRALIQKLEGRFKPHRTANGRGFAGLKVKDDAHEWG
jgi:phage/plasmid-associated DNA primase